jgi:hypothetical protein
MLGDAPVPEIRALQMHGNRPKMSEGTPTRQSITWRVRDRFSRFQVLLKEGMMGRRLRENEENLFQNKEMGEVSRDPIFR